MNWHQRIKQRLQQRQSANIYRTRQPNQAVGCCRLLINNKKYINFSSNDYLGLSQNKSIIAAWQQGAKRYSAGVIN